MNLEGSRFLQPDLLRSERTTRRIARVSLRNTVLTQTALAALVDGGSHPWYIGIGELPGITELDLSGVDFAAITDLSPLYLMDNLTDLWLVDVENLDADALDVLLDNLATMENPSIEGTLYLTQADLRRLQRGRRRETGRSGTPSRGTTSKSCPSPLAALSLLLGLLTVAVLAARQRGPGRRPGSLKDASWPDVLLAAWAFTPAVCFYLKMVDNTPMVVQNGHRAPDDSKPLFQAGNAPAVPRLDRARSAR